MHMYLQGAQVYTIMLQERWSSDAFLLYIRRQVQQFSEGLSNGMVKKESFSKFQKTNYIRETIPEQETRTLQPRASL